MIYSRAATEHEKRQWGIKWAILVCLFQGKVGSIWRNLFLFFGRFYVAEFNSTHLRYCNIKYTRLFEFLKLSYRSNGVFFSLISIQILGRFLQHNIWIFALASGEVCVQFFYWNVKLFLFFFFFWMFNIWTRRATQSGVCVNNRRWLLTIWNPTIQDK